MLLRSLLCLAVAGSATGLSCDGYTREPTMGTYIGYATKFISSPFGVKNAEGATGLLGKGAFPAAVVAGLVSNTVGIYYAEKSRIKEVNFKRNLCASFAKMDKRVTELEKKVAHLEEASLIRDLTHELARIKTLKDAQDNYCYWSYAHYAISGNRHILAPCRDHKKHVNLAFTMFLLARLSGWSLQVVTPNTNTNSRLVCVAGHRVSISRGFSFQTPVRVRADNPNGVNRAFCAHLSPMELAALHWFNAYLPIEIVPRYERDFNNQHYNQYLSVGVCDNVHKKVPEHVEKKGEGEEWLFSHSMQAMVHQACAAELVVGIYKIGNVKTKIMNVNSWWRSMPGFIGGNAEIAVTMTLKPHGPRVPYTGKVRYQTGGQVIVSGAERNDHDRPMEDFTLGQASDELVAVMGPAMHKIFMDKKQNYLREVI